MEEIECYQEILGQKMAWEEAVQVTGQKKAQIARFFDALKPSEIYFLGCTSPYYAGTAAAAFIKTEANLEAKAVQSSELFLYPAYHDPNPPANPVLIALSRSGKTTETILAVEEFNRKYPGRVILISCNPEGRLNRSASLSLFLTKSAENTIPQTRSLSAMYLASLLLLTYYSGRAGTLEALQQAPSQVEGIIQKSNETVKALMQGRRFKNIFVLGSGPLFGMAQEIGLKLMEMTTTDTFSYPFLESRHGPRALIDENTLVVGLFSRGGLNYEAQLMDELTNRHKATTLAIVPEKGWKTGNVTTCISVDSAWPDSFLGLAYLPVGQLVALHYAIATGLNPDVARNHTQYVEIEQFS